MHTATHTQTDGQTENVMPSAAHRMSGLGKNIYKLCRSYEYQQWRGGIKSVEIGFYLIMLSALSFLQCSDTLRLADSKGVWSPETEGGSVAE